MRIYPVLDLMHGHVVRGVAGQRERYQPLVSPLVSSSEPIAVARALRDHLQLNELYLADLDAIAGKPPAVEIYAALQANGFRLLVDAGLRSGADAAPLLDCGLASIVAGLETLTGPEALADLLRTVGIERLIFSLDLKNGQPLTTSAAWSAAAPIDLAVKVIELGVRRILILDLARVGVGSGTGTETLCRQLKRTFPHLDLLAGGGVRGRDDLERLQQCGVDGVLVASALHDGRLRRGDWGSGSARSMPLPGPSGDTV